MTNSKATMTVLGAGSYGTALAIAIARNGQRTVLWGHEPEHVAALNAARENQDFLPGITFPDSLELEADLATAVAQSDNLLVVVPSFAFADIMRQIKPMLSAESRVAWATKGLEANTGHLLSEVAVEVLGEQRSLAVISGPTFAKELAAGLPTAISASSSDTDFVSYLAEVMRCERSFRVYTNNDIVGVQLGGAVKNVIAIGAGLADGLGFGANARTALITRGLREMARLGKALGAEAETFKGMAGLGDLVLTCTDNQSRNRRFGLALGAGKSLEQAEADIGQVVEGYRNTKEVYLLAQRVGVEMPIVEQVYQVLYKAKSPKQAAMDLLARDQREE
ncbi:MULTISPECIES: NAD(P)H-dependent glycerol-3-phosphate dehydrogenase [unclassified Agarivorans]|uniref:NAD(P)H-dependent glycerol-3-phosphate dehydrogenase n=1 Tax=unclassified Agarivorans TaxID=2636026 RepID=UPI0010F8697C|nr:MULTISPECIES: NAD(P)H-dependent glycerol-3-phosphate dehydrogenase [unclassified Agarivorans]MDO6687467.1 NAD(P)H-dependent glycerol-3-phosphate dehydrogenase [Agarivorans sp. 3_MG-2023]MDO6715233.1 NAD(P)H-dependent glycerol-3-phosphate dehydrogenase [Agarivorans sp. 2_MG-2023]